MNAAKLILTCKAMRVFSGSTWTGPRADTAASTVSKVARTCGLAWVKCWSRSPRAAQAWAWWRLAKLRPHSGQAHMPVTGRGSAVVVFIVGDVLSPVRVRSLVSGDGFGDGQVGHDAV